MQKEFLLYLGVPDGRSKVLDTLAKIKPGEQVKAALRLHVVDSAIVNGELLTRLNQLRGFVKVEVLAADDGQVKRLNELAKGMSRVTVVKL